MEGRNDNTELKTVVRYRLIEGGKYKVKFKVTSTVDGSCYRGSIVFISKPKLSKVIRFIYGELDLHTNFVTLTNA